jgi:hypothetical protein
MWTKENRGRYDRSKLRYPSDVTNEEWALIEPLIPQAKGGGKTRTVVMREVVNGLIRDSPDGSLTGVDTHVFPAFPQDRSAVRAATVNSGSPNGGRGADLAIFAGIWTHSSHRQLLNTGPSGVSRRRWWRLWL